MLFLLLGCVPELTSPESKAASLSDCVGEGNSWPAGDLVWSPPSSVDAFVTDSVAPNFCFGDQFGDPVALWQFNTHYTVLDVSALWCIPCQNLAADVQATADAHPGLVYLTVHREDLGNDPPDTEELLQWAEYFGIDQPVVSDTTGWSDPLTGGTSFPAVVLLDEQLRVVTRVPDSYLADPEATREYLERFIP